MDRKGEVINCGGTFIRADFIERMDAELVTNSKTKGDWKNWMPDKLLLISEITWHFSKLVTALMNDDRQKVSEYAADLANYGMKADEVYGASTVAEGKS